MVYARVVTAEQATRLYVEVELGIPAEESSVPPSADRDRIRAEAVAFITYAQENDLEYDLPFD